MATVTSGPQVHTGSCSSAEQDPDELSDVRINLREERNRSLAEPGCYLDRSVTGAGKTHACMATIAELVETTDKRALIAVKSHAAANELVRDYRHEECLPVVAHVPRTTVPWKRAMICPFCGICPPGPAKEDCPHCKGRGQIKGFISCWNPEADEAERNGFSVRPSVCRYCRFEKQCLERGYLRLNQLATDARISVATHARLEHRGFAESTEGYSYISFQEDPISVLRPQQETSFAAFKIFDSVFDLILGDPKILDQLGTSESEPDWPSLHACLMRMALISKLILEYAPSAADADSAPVTVIPLPDALPLPTRVDERVWRFIRGRVSLPDEQVFPVLLAAATGGLHSLVLFRPSAYQPMRLRPRRESPVKTLEPSAEFFPDLNVIATFRNDPPDNKPIWFADASMPVRRLEAALGKPLKGVIEPSHLPRKKRIRHIPRDVSRKTKDPRIIRQLLREALALYPKCRRAGVICHMPHKKAIQKLEPIFRSRIEKIEHFGSDADRGSNSWYRDCDLLIVLGTPRIPPKAIAMELIRLGEIEAAARNSTWGKRVVFAQTEVGVEDSYASSAYHEQRWQEVYEALVREALLQAIGRGRSYLDEGIDVVVFSNEELGLPILPSCQLPGLTGAVGRLIRHLCALVSNRELLEGSAQNGHGKRRKKGTGTVSVKTTEILEYLSRNSPEPKSRRRQLNKLLQKACAAGIVRKVGKKSGWWLADDWLPKKQPPEGSLVS